MSGAEPAVVTDDQPLPPRAIVARRRQPSPRSPRRHTRPRQARRRRFRPPHRRRSPRRRRHRETRHALRLHDPARKARRPLVHADDHARPAAQRPSRSHTLDETQIPAFEYREPYFKEALDKDWAARLKTNGHFAGLDESTGGKITYGAFCHTFDLLVPQDLFADAPRVLPAHQGQAHQRLRPAVPHQPGRAARCRIERRPRVDAEEPDAHDLLRQPERHAQRLRVRRVRRDRAAVRRQARRACTCGSSTRSPRRWRRSFPTSWSTRWRTSSPRPRRRGSRRGRTCAIRLCPIAVCEAHPYEQCADKPTRRSSNRLAKWAEITDTLYIWHYSTQFHHYLAPFPDFKQFPDSIRLYQRSGVKGVFFQGSYSSTGGSDAEMRAYVMAKLLWDPNADADALVTEWMQRRVRRRRGEADAAVVRPAA